MKFDLMTLSRTFALLIYFINNITRKFCFYKRNKKFSVRKQDYLAGAVLALLATAAAATGF
jgi:hypothetical protein